jgi:hypothetical protein
LGKAMIATVQKQHPNLIVGKIFRCFCLNLIFLSESIPHGFFSFGCDDVESVCVGSVTTWTDMRYVKDVLCLVEKMKDVKCKDVLVYLGGSFDEQNRLFVIERPNHFTTINSSIASSIQTEKQFRDVITSLSENGKIICNLDNIFKVRILKIFFFFFVVN